MAYLEWDFEWKDKKTGKTGWYRSGSTGLQSEEDVIKHVSENFHGKLDFIQCRLVGEGVQKVSAQSMIPVKAIDPEHVLGGTVAERNAEVRKFIKG